MCGTLSRGLPFVQLRTTIEEAINTIYSREAYLLANGLAEWTLSAQFHYWVRKLCEDSMKGYDFDSEYNHMHLVGKNDVAEKDICNNGELKNVRPDFIIHKRGKTSHNFLWVEIKRRGGRGWEQDLKRLEDVIKEQSPESISAYVSGYSFGLGVLFHKDNVTCIWFENEIRPRIRKAFIGDNCQLVWHDCDEERSRQ